MVYNNGRDVCHTLTFDSLDVGSSYLHMRNISIDYGSSLYKKVIGSRSRSQEPKRSKFLFLQCKISIDNNYRSSKHRAVMFASSSMGFSGTVLYCTIQGGGASARLIAPRAVLRPHERVQCTFPVGRGSLYECTCAFVYSCTS